MKLILELNETNFDREVLQSSVPVVVDFWGQWCGPCKMLAPALEEVARDLQGEAVVANVNVDEQTQLAARFGVQSVPTLLYFRGGEPRDRTVGVVSKNTIVTKLRALSMAKAATQTT